MRSFDYKRAWREVAEPAVLNLPQNVRDLYIRTVGVAAGLHQLPNLDMPWPNADGFKTAFEEIPLEWLSVGARAIYFYGFLEACTTGKGLR